MNKKVKKEAKNQPQAQRVTPRNKVDRNGPCSCGSGKKLKKCCLFKSKMNIGLLK
jgi:uncharacterized protein YchJ